MVAGDSSFRTRNTDVLESSPKTCMNKIEAIRTNMSSSLLTLTNLTTFPKCTKHTLLNHSNTRHQTLSKTLREQGTEFSSTIKSNSLLITADV